MSLSSVEELREIYNHLVKNPPDAAVRNQLAKVVGQLKKEWDGERSLQTKEKVLSLIIALYSKIKGEISGLLELYEKFLLTFQSEQCVVCGLLLMLFLPKDKLSSKLLPCVQQFDAQEPMMASKRMIDESSSSQLGALTQKSNWAGRFIAQLLFINFKMLPLIDLRFLHDKVIGLKDEYILVNTLERIRELVWALNKQAKLLNEKLPLKFEEIESLEALLLKRCYQFEVNEDPKSNKTKFDPRRAVYICQTLIEIIFLKLNYYLDYDLIVQLQLDQRHAFAQEIRWVIHLGHSDFLFRLLPGLLQVNLISSNQELVRCFEKATLISHFLSSAAPKEVKSILDLLFIACRRFVKSTKITRESFKQLKNCLLRLIEVSEEKALEADARNCIDSFTVIFRISHLLAEEHPGLIDGTLIERFMRANTSRNSMQARIKEVELVLFLIDSSVLKELEESQTGYLPSFIQLLFNYIKTFPDSPRLRLQLSVIEFLQNLSSRAVQISGSESVSSKLAGILLLESQYLDDFFRTSSGLELGSRIRYYYHKLIKELGSQKEQKEADLEVALAIKKRLDILLQALKNDPDFTDSDNHSTSLLKAMKDAKISAFAKRISSDPFLVKVLNNLSMLAKFHYNFELAALCSKCLLLVLLNEESRPVQDNPVCQEKRQQPAGGPDAAAGNESSDEEIICLSLLVDYCKSLVELGDDNVISWMAIILNRLNDFQLKTERSCIGERYTKILQSSAFLDVDRILRDLGPEISQRYSLKIFDSQGHQDDLVLRIKTNKNCHKHFSLYARFMESKIMNEKDPYTRASCIKELINAISCMRDNFLQHIYSRKDQSTETIDNQIRVLNYFLSPIRDTSQSITQLCTIMRQVLTTAHKTSIQLMMFNLSLKIVKLMKTIALISCCLDDYILYLNFKSELKRSTHPGSKIMAFWAFAKLPIEEWAREKSSSKRLVEDHREEVLRVIKRCQVHKKAELIELLVNSLNDHQTELGRPVAVVFSHSIQKMLLARTVAGLKERFEEIGLRQMLDQICRKLAVKHSKFVDFLFQAKEISADIYKHEVEELRDSLSHVLSDDRLTLTQQAYFLDCTHLNLLNALFSRINTFQPHHELICVKVAQSCFWASAQLGLFSRARHFLELISHFVYCHCERSQRSEHRLDSMVDPFCLTPDELGNMVKVSINPSYDLKRHIKLNSLEIVKRRDSYLRTSLRRLTIRKVGSLKEFFKYSLYFNDKIAPAKPYSENLSLYMRDCSSKIIAITFYQNILDYLSKDDRLSIIYRFDGKCWSYALCSEVLVQTVNSTVRLINDNENSLRDSTKRGENEKVNAKEWWGMRKKYEMEMEDNMNSLEKALGLDLMLFSHQIQFDAETEDNGMRKTDAEVECLMSLTDNSSNHMLMKRFSSTHRSLIDWWQENISSKQTQKSTGDISASKDNSCLYLLIEGSAFLVPFEHLNGVAELRTELFRLPHISECPEKAQVYSHYSHEDTENIRFRSRDLHEDDPPQCYYLLNPSGDLKNTEVRMKEYLEKRFFQWKGKIGVEPLASEIARYLKKSCHFLYSTLTQLHRPRRRRHLLQPRLPEQTGEPAEHRHPHGLLFRSDVPSEGHREAPVHRTRRHRQRLLHQPGVRSLHAAK